MFKYSVLWQNRGKNKTHDLSFVLASSSYLVCRLLSHQSLNCLSDGNHGCVQMKCEHLCLLGARQNGRTSGTCFCANGYKLADDGRSCIGKWLQNASLSQNNKAVHPSIHLSIFLCQKRATYDPLLHSKVRFFSDTSSAIFKGSGQ